MSAAASWPPSEFCALVRRYVAEQEAAGRFAASTAKGRRRRLLMFAYESGRPHPAEVTRADVEAFVGAAGLGQSTRRAMLSALRMLWAWLLEAGEVTADPTAAVPRVREPRRLPRQLGADDIARLLAVAPDARARLIVLLEWRCGLRACEVARAQVEDIDTSAQTLKVHGKGGHERLVPVPAAVAAAVAEYFAAVPAPTTGPLLRSYHPDPTQGLSAAYVVNRVGKWMRAAGINESGHALRHSIAGELVRQVDVRTVQLFLGHSNVATTSRYLGHADIEGLRGALDGNALINGQVTNMTPTGEPTLDPSGPLIDAVAALTATVTELQAQVAALAGQDPVAQLTRPPWPEPAPEPTVTCELCGMTSRASFMERYHQAEDHCPECSQPGWGSPLKMAQHRFKAHGVAYASSCTWEERHDHTPAGRCVCPLCGHTSATIVYGGRTMASHHATPHHRCPDCDLAFTHLARHRHAKHQWAAQ